MNKQTNLNLAFPAMLMAIAFTFSAASVKAQDGKRYEVGEIKVGDRVEADPMVIKKFMKCTVVKINMRLDNSAIDTFSIRCDGASGNGSIPYQVIATEDLVHPLKRAVQEPSKAEVQNETNQPDAQVARNIKTNKYGTRDAITCADTKAPARGAISAALAAKYFICEAEGVKGDYLYLVENVKTEVGAGRPYNRNDDVNFFQIDSRFPVYPIRGSFRQYQCEPVESNPAIQSIYNVGENCSTYENRKAVGSCYKTTFGDWRCTMEDINIAAEDKKHRVAPPK